MKDNLFENFSPRTFLYHYLISAITLFVLGFLILVFSSFEGLHTSNIVFFFGINLVSSFVLSVAFQKRGYKTIERIVAAIIITTFVLIRIIPLPSELVNRVDTKNSHRDSKVDRFWSKSEHDIRAMEKGVLVTENKLELVKYVQYKLKSKRNVFYYFYNDKLIGIIKEYPYDDRSFEKSKKNFLDLYGSSDAKAKGLYMWSLKKTIIGVIPLSRDSVKLFAVSYLDKGIMKLDNARQILKNIASLRK